VKFTSVEINFHADFFHLTICFSFLQVFSTASIFRGEAIFCFMNSEFRNAEFHVKKRKLGATLFELSLCEEPEQVIVNVFQICFFQVDSVVLC